MPEPVIDKKTAKPSPKLDMALLTTEEDPFGFEAESSLGLFVRSSESLGNAAAGMSNVGSLAAVLACISMAKFKMRSDRKSRRGLDFIFLFRLIEVFLR